MFVASAGAAYASDLDFCHDEELMTFEDYQSWIKITEEPVISYAHGENWIDIYANKLAAEQRQIVRTQGLVRPSGSRQTEHHAAFDGRPSLP